MDGQMVRLEYLIGAARYAPLIAPPIAPLEPDLKPDLPISRRFGCPMHLKTVYSALP